MNVSDLKKVYENMKSNFQDPISNLKSIAAELHDLWKSNCDIAVFLSECGRLKDVEEDEVIFIDDDVKNFITSNNVKEVCFNINTSDNALIEISREGPDSPLFDIYYDDYDRDVGVLNIDNNTITRRDDSDDFYKLCASQSKVIAKTAGMYYALADICDAAGSSAWTSIDQITTTLTSLAERYASALGTFTNDIIKAIASGPQSLLQLISTLIEKVYTLASNNDLSALLNSTSIVLNNFAWGGVVATIGTVLTAASTIVLAISKIAGAIVAGLGIVTQVVGRIIVSATTAFDDTQYKVSAGSDTAHCFTFVVNQDHISNPEVANFMRSQGWATMNVFCPHQGLLYFMYLDNYDDENDYNITYEAHLSSDIDISSNLRSIRLGNTQKYVSGILLPTDPDGGKTVLFGYQRFTTDANGYTLPFAFMNAAGTGGNTYVSPRIRLSKLMLDQYTDIIRPVEFSLFDTFKQWLGSDLVHFLDVRLCSALIIHLLYLIGPIFTGHYTEYSSSTVDFRVLYMSNTYHTAYINSGLDNFVTLWSAAWNCFCTSNGIYTEDDNLKSSYGLNNTQRDNLLNCIVNVYDTLKYKNFHLSETLPVSVLRFYDNGGSMAYTILSTQSTHYIDDTSANNVFAYDGLFTHMYSTCGLYNDWTNSLSLLGSGYWPSSFAIELPTLTFTGFIAGLIVDGLVLVAAATIAVFATVGWIKLRNKRAMLQAKAEAAWYNWQDNGMTDAQWKEYKTARLKYNIMALATGGSTLSLGLYDSESETGSIINTILDGKQDEGQSTDSVSLHSIKELISG